MKKSNFSELRKKILTPSYEDGGIIQKPLPRGQIESNDIKSYLRENEIKKALLDKNISPEQRKVLQAELIKNQISRPTVRMAGGGNLFGNMYGAALGEAVQKAGEVQELAPKEQTLARRLEDGEKLTPEEMERLRNGENYKCGGIVKKYKWGGIADNETPEQKLGSTVSAELDPQFNVSEQFKKFRPLPEYKNLNDDELIDAIIKSNKKEKEDIEEKRKNKEGMQFKFANGGVVYNPDPIQESLRRLAIDKINRYRNGGIIEDNGMNYVGDEVDANVNEGEIIVNLEGQQNLMDAIQGKIPFEALRNERPIIRQATPEETNVTKKQKEQEIRLNAVEDILFNIFGKGK